MNKTRFFALSALFIFATSLPAFAANSELNAKIQTLDTTLSALLAQDNFSGNILVAEKGVPVFSKSYGLADREAKIPLKPDSTFVIGSVTKQFVGAALVLLMREGKLSLSNTIGDYLPTAPLDKRNITLRELVSHTSGMPDCYYVFEKVPQPELDALDYVNDPVSVLNTYLKYAPRKPNPGFEYNNCGYTILAYAIQQASGQRYEDFMVEHLFRPAGMMDTGFCRNPQTLHVEQASTGYEADGKKAFRADELEYDWNGWKGSDGVVSNAPDMLRWLNVLDSGALISPQEQYQQLFNPLSYNPSYKSHYALGWMVDWDASMSTILRYAHSGGTPGFITYFQNSLSQKTQVIFLGNRYHKDGFRAVLKTFR